MPPLTPVRLGPPCRRPILNATTSSLYARRCTRDRRPLCREHRTPPAHVRHRYLLKRRLFVSCVSDHPAFAATANSFRAKEPSQKSSNLAPFRAVPFSLVRIEQTA